MAIELSFHGATDTVTGSRYLVKADIIGSSCLSLASGGVMPDLDTTTVSE